MTYVDELGIQALAACDGCGKVGALVRRHGWRFWREAEIFRHHCRECVEHNELVRSCLVFRVDPTTAVDYENWTGQ